jgi:hypothetical protein
MGLILVPEENLENYQATFENRRYSAADHLALAASLTGGNPDSWFHSQ